MQKGWNKISVKINQNANVDPFLSMFLSGYLESRLSMSDVNNFWQNLVANNDSDGQLGKVRLFFTKVISGLNNKIHNFDSIDSNLKDLYFKAFYFYVQLIGFHRGYNDSRNQVGDSLIATLSLPELLIIQADGEISELISNCLNLL